MSTTNTTPPETPQQQVSDAPAPPKPATPRPKHIAVALSHPQLGENIGMAARAMGNFALRDLRIIAPRDGWPNDKAKDASKHAHAIIERAKVFSRTEEALADARHIYAITARPRDMRLPCITPEEAARRCIEADKKGEQSVLLFGKERDGLTNDEVALASAAVSIPACPDYPSLNLAQAVSVICYGVYRAALDASEAEEAKGAYAAGWRNEPPATGEQLRNFTDALENALDEGGYFRTPEKREGAVTALRTFFSRAAPSEQETGMLHGIINVLHRRKP